MRGLRRICALGVSGLVLGGMLAGVAPQVASSAPLARDTPEVFAGTAAATALKLGLFGTNLTVSTSNVEADSAPKAHADGAGVALIAATVSSADSVGAGQTSQPPKACGLHLPLASLLTLDLACSASATQTTSSAPAALAGSNIAALDVSALSTILNLLQPILAPLLPVADQLVGTVLTTVQTAVSPLLGPTSLTQLLGGLGVQTNAPVSSLITALEKATNLLEVHVGDTVSQVVTTAGSVVADSDAQGATVALLPGLGSTGLLTITVGHAHTTSTFNRTSGNSAATFNPSILEIKLLGTVIPLGLGNEITLFAGTPLESTISLGAGHTATNPDGSVSAVADGVGIDLLKGINGGISLHLAHAESAAGGHLAVVIPTTTTTAVVVNIPPQAIVREPGLATTGTDTPLLPIGAFLILAGYVTRRTIRARRAARAPR